MINSLKQFMRRPFRAILFLVLLTLAGAFLCLCAGLWGSAQQNIAHAEESFTTIAVPNMAAVRDLAGVQEIVYDAYRLWPTFRQIDAQDEAQKRLHDLVPLVQQTGLSSALAKPDPRRLLMAYAGDVSAVREGYEIASLLPKLYYDPPYNRVAYVGTCKDVGIVHLSALSIEEDVENVFISTQTEYNIKSDRAKSMIDPEAQAQLKAAYHATFTFEEALAYNGEPVFIADWIYAETINMYSPDELPSPPFEVGKRYLLIGNYKNNGGLAWGGMNHDGYLMPENASYEDIVENYPAYQYCLHLLPVQYERPSEKMRVTYKYDLTHSVPIDEARVEVQGDLETFLEDPNNAFWKQSIEEINITNHSVEVLTTENLQSLYPFHENTSNITDGRAFTVEEAQQGAQVCVISHTLAKANKLKVGDTLPLQFYPGRFQAKRFDGESFLDDLYTAARPLPYVSTMELAAERSYEIVGIYTGPAWQSADYAIPANTVIIPDAAVPAVEDIPSLYADDERDIPPMILHTLVLENKNIDAFYEEMGGKEYGRMYKILDQGYTALVPSLVVIRNNAAALLGIGVIAWIAILVLFLVIFILRLRKEAGVMISLGLNRRAAARRILVGVFLLTLLSILLSAGAGYALQDTMTDLVLKAPTTESAHVGDYSNLPVAQDTEEAASRLQAALKTDSMSALLLATAILQGLLILAASWGCAHRMTSKSPLELMQSKEG